VVMPSKFLDGVMKVVLTTGSVLTHGVDLGDCKDTSRLRLETVELMLVRILAYQILTLLKSLLNDDYLTNNFELRFHNNS